MRLALRELRRRFRKFLPTTAALALLVVLLLMLGGLLDGLFLGSTGALRAQQLGARRVLRLRPRLRHPVAHRSADPWRRSRRSTASRPPTASAWRWSGARVPGETEHRRRRGHRLRGHRRRRARAARRPAQAWADKSLKADGVSEGDVVKVGPTRIPLEVVGFVERHQLPPAGRALGGARHLARGPGRVAAGRRRRRRRVPDRVGRRRAGRRPGPTSPPAIDAGHRAPRRRSPATRPSSPSPGSRSRRRRSPRSSASRSSSPGSSSRCSSRCSRSNAPRMFGVLKAVGASSRQLVAALATQTLVVTALAVRRSAPSSPSRSPSSSRPTSPSRSPCRGRCSSAVGVLVAAAHRRARSRSAASSGSTPPRPSAPAPERPDHARPAAPQRPQDLPVRRHRDRRARPRDPRRRRRRDPRAHRSVGLGQDHPAVDRRRPALPHRGRGDRGRARHHRVLGQGAHHVPARAGGLRVPDREPRAVPHRARERDDRGRARRARQREGHQGPGRPAARGARAWPAGRATSPPSCRAASVSGSRSAGRS